jgi:glycerol kinase
MAMIHDGATATRPGRSTAVAERPTYLLGLDAGNTVIKAVLFDRDGRQVAIARADGHQLQPAPGHVERDLGELWANAARPSAACIAGRRSIRARSRPSAAPAMATGSTCSTVPASR